MPQGMEQMRTRLQRAPHSENVNGKLKINVNVLATKDR